MVKNINKLGVKAPALMVTQRYAGRSRGGQKIYLDYIPWYSYADALDSLCPGWVPEILDEGIHTYIDYEEEEDGGREVSIYKVVLRLTLPEPDGRQVDNVGSAEMGGIDPMPSAWAQAFKRCCATLGLFRDLYVGKDDGASWESVVRRYKYYLGYIKERLSDPTYEPEFSTTLQKQVHAELRFRDLDLADKSFKELLLSLIHEDMTLEGMRNYDLIDSLYHALPDSASSSETRLTIKNNGNVGIGATDPSRLSDDKEKQ